jgi:hypothetical protein
VANKLIDGKQCTAIWHVDDLKISHVEPKTVDDSTDARGVHKQRDHDLGFVRHLVQCLSPTYSTKLKESAMDLISYR